MSHNVLVIGGGGREHAIVWALGKSPQVAKIWCAPGNAGIASLAVCVDIDWRDSKKFTQFLEDKKIDMTVIGPEAPLVEGLADSLRAQNRLAFGPGRAAARLEGSKVFSKNFMKNYGIPTADFRSFSHAEDALNFVDSPEWKNHWRIVKASGLAAGKGVYVCKDKAAVKAAIDECMVKKSLGGAGDQIVIEETLEGEELSILALCDGETLLALVPSQDHKRVFDNDQGPNTGGMGAYAPVPQLDPALWPRFEKEIFAPFLKGLKEENLDFCGVIYFGLMLTQSGPKVLEFNTRFGDPETQVVLPLIENDWYEVFLAAIERRLAQVSLKRKKGAALCVVMAAPGYPGNYPKNIPISGLDAAAKRPDVVVFHAGTEKSGGQIKTTGGRVLAVTAIGADFETARQKAYEALNDISFDGAHFRKDIGERAMTAAAKDRHSRLCGNDGE
jgi:phosphoribosylamine--glycine ligase